MGFDINAIAGSIGNAIGQAGDSAGKLIQNVGDSVGAVMKNGISIPEIRPQDILVSAMKLNGIRICRDEYLRKEFGPFCSEEVIAKAIEETPTAAGIPDDTLHKIAVQCIDWETNKTTALSFAAGLPGGFGLAAAIPADLAQYYGNLLRVMQKLAYLYGFSEFELSQDQIRDETMNQLLVMLGVMMGVQEANAAIKTVARTASNRAAKVIARKALTKNACYRIIQKAAKAVGIRMTKETFAKSVSKTIPVVGGVVSGGLTYATFRPSAQRLHASLISMVQEDIL